MMYSQLCDDKHEREYFYTPSTTPWGIMFYSCPYVCSDVVKVEKNANNNTTYISLAYSVLKLWKSKQEKYKPYIQ